jgi:hypothetical protein
MISHFDHIYCHAPNNELERALKKFNLAGFIISPRKARHPAGHYNGFILLTHSYLELVSIVDEAEFANEADDEEKYFREYPRPFGIGALTVDPDKAYLGIKSLYPDVLPPYSRGEVGVEDPEPLWTFVPIPKESTPGADVFSLKYLRPAPFEVRSGPNCIYAVGGFYFCTETPEADFQIWSQTLIVSASHLVRHHLELEVGFQKLKWISPQQYKVDFGEDWANAPFHSGKVAAVILYSTNLNTSIDCMQAAGFILSKKSEHEAFFRRDSITGYTLILKERPVGDVDFMPLSAP